MLTLTDLLAIEEDLQVLEFAFEHDDFLMWPLIRAYVLLEALYAEYGLKNAHAHSGHLSLQELASYVATTVRENPFRDASPRSIVMFSSGITNVQRGDTYFNRLHDHFALELQQDTLIIEDSVRRHYLRPRRFQPVRSHDWIHIQGAFGARLTRLSSRDRANTLGLIRYLKAHFPHNFEPSFWDAVQAMLVERGKRLNAQHKCYDALFERLRPRVVFVDGTSGEVDLGTFLRSDQVGGTVFEPLGRLEFFGQVKIVHGTVEWPNGADLAPDAMHDAIRETGRWTS